MGRNDTEYRQTGYDGLATGIVIQAVNDYKDALILGRGKKVPKDSTVETLEDFFRSEWFQLLTDIDGEVLIQQIRKMVEGKKNI